MSPFQLSMLALLLGANAEEDASSMLQWARPATSLQHLPMDASAPTTLPFTPDSGPHQLLYQLTTELFAGPTPCGLNCFQRQVKNDAGFMLCLSNSTVDASYVITKQNGSAVYDEARRTFNNNLRQFPFAVVYAHSTSDVKWAVACATIGGFKVSANGGKHSALGFGVLDGHVVIDTSNLTAPAIVDNGTNTMLIGAGYTNGMVLHYLAAKAPRNAALTIGMCGSVGYAGYMFGGGIGLATGLVGLACDSLTEIEMVLYNGTIINASRRENNDIFWATCGGGGGLGIMTKMNVTYSLADTSKFTVGTLNFKKQASLKEQADMISTGLEVVGSTENHVYGGSGHFGRSGFSLTGMLLSSKAGVKQLMNETNWNLSQYIQDYDNLFEHSTFPRASAASVCSNFFDQVFTPGTKKTVQDEAKDQVSIQLGRNISNITSATYRHICHTDVDLIDKILYIAQNRTSFINWPFFPGYWSFESSGYWPAPFSRMVPKLFPEALESFLASVGDANITIAHWISGKAMEIDASATAFPWRTSPFLLNLDSAEQLGNLLAVLKHEPGQVGSYWNYPNPSASNWQQLYFGKNYKRLAQLRAKHDPLDIFGKEFSPGQDFEAN